MNTIVVFLLVTSALIVPGATRTPTVKPDDFMRLTGAQWKGTLTYLDYGTKKKVAIPSNIAVTQSPDDKLSWVFEYQYPDEPNANSRETVTISKNGQTIGGAMVAERVNLPDNTLKIVTTESGFDDEKKAQLRFTYLISEKSFSIRKEVSFDDATGFFERHEYRWTR